jgi:hypothetical protein
MSSNTLSYNEVDIIKYGEGSFDNDYLNNFVNKFSNKYEKILKIEKKLINIFFYL